MTTTSHNPEFLRKRRKALLLVSLLILLVLLMGWQLILDRAEPVGIGFWVELGLILLLVPILFWADRGSLSILQEEMERMRQLEGRVLRANSQTEAILAAISEPVIAIDDTGRILEANGACEAVFGYLREELQGQNVAILMEEPYRSEHDGYLANYLRTGVKKAIGKNRQVAGRKKDGTAFPCEISITEANIGDTRNFVGLIRDMTQERELSLKFAQAERLAAVGELAAGVSHEINNPINTILNCAQLLKDGDEDPELVQDITDEGERIAKIVRSLLDFAKEHSEEMNAVDLGALVQRTLGLIRRRIQRPGIEVRMRIEEDLPRPWLCAHQIQQVLMNLLLNSRDAILQDGSRTEPGLIEVSLESTLFENNQGILLKVRDNGPGVPRDSQDRIFTPFFTTKREAGGTGLGLPVSLGIIQKHGGKLEVSSDGKSYCEMRILLTLLPPDVTS
jgi:PAS domain S-box-containing protein